MTFIAAKSHVANRGAPPDSFLAQLVQWGKIAPGAIFALNNEPDDVMNLIRPALGPWESITHRRCAMLEMMRVLAMFESSGNWNEGRDVTNPTEDNPETMSAGAWQISWNSRHFGQDLQDLAAAAGVVDGVAFQKETKSNHAFAMTWCAMLTRHTIKHNGPLKRGEVLPWLRRAAVQEFQELIFPA